MHGNYYVRIQNRFRFIPYTSIFTIHSLQLFCLLSICSHGTKQYTCIVHVASTACHRIHVAVRCASNSLHSLFTVCISSEVKIGARRILTWTRRNRRRIYTNRIYYCFIPLQKRGIKIECSRVWCIVLGTKQCD